MSLYDVVELYRKSGRPELNGGVFAGQVPYGQVRDILGRIRADDGQQRGRFIELLIDGDEVAENEELPSSGDELEFRFRTPGSSSKRFYSNFRSFVENSHEISRGHVPADFYLIEEDFYVGEEKDVPGMGQLEALCRLIRALSELAHYHDDKASSGYMRLVFMRPAEAGAVSVVLETKVDAELVCSAENLDLTLLDELVSGSVSSDPHYTAKLGVFEIALVDFLDVADAKNVEFSYLVSCWEKFLEVYHNNLKTYLSGFAFHKAKKEVAEAELSLANKFSSVLSDIAAKLFGIPVSLLAVIAIPRAGGFIESNLIVLGVLLSSMLISGSVSNQQRKFDRVKHARDMVLRSLEGKKEAYPEDLRRDLEKISIGLRKDEFRLNILLWSFRVLSWLPAFLAVMVHSLYYSPEFRGWLIIF